jgi:PAS domain S-box-containing protein
LNSLGKKDFLDMAQTGCWQWDLVADKVTCFSSYAQLVGWDRTDKLPDGNWLPCVYELDIKPTKQKILEFLQFGKEVFEVDFRVMCRKSGIRWHLCRGRADSNHPGSQINQITFLNIDITNLHQKIDHLKESDRQLQTILKIIPGVVYRINLSQDHPHIYVSPQSEEVLGYTDVDAFKYRVRGTVHPDDIEEMSRQVDEAVEKHEPFESVFRVIMPDGGWKWIWERGVGVYDENGEAVAIDGFLMDMTHQRTKEAALRKENMLLKSTLKDRYRFKNIVGKSEPMQAVYRQISKAVASKANIIIYGESGTGKELVARAVHDLSDRRDKRFVAVNCGGIAESLLEREFFGHTKGAFTGAREDKKGFLDLAQDGTLFLDELGEISKRLQVKLLRVLDGHGYTAVGGNKVQKPDIRIIAATNKNLKELVAKGRMREDFFYRIHVLPIRLPALRDRKEDIPLLVEHFLEKFSDGHEPANISASMLDALKNHHWTGNVRELQNIIHRYMVFGKLDVPIQKAADVSRPSHHHDIVGPGTLGSQMARMERLIIINSLERNKWHRGKVAIELGINPKTLYRKLKNIQAKKP